MVKIVNLPGPTSGPSPSKDEQTHGRADTQLRQLLFAWAEAVLKQLGLHSAVAAATSIEALHAVKFDAANDLEVMLLIRDALHPASGRAEKHFRGLKEPQLKRILQNRFAEL